MTLFQKHPLLKRLHCFGNRPFIQSQNKKSYEDLFYRSESLIAEYLKIKEERVAFCAANLFDFLTLLIAGEYSGKTMIVLSRHLGQKDIQELASLLSFRLLITDRKIKFKGKLVCPDSLISLKKDKVRYRPGRIILTTSGSTGTPKGVVRNWKNLLSGISITPRGKTAVWLLTYDFASFAGIQVILHALLNGAQIVDGSENVFAALRNKSISHISATPSFWRKLLVQIKKKEDLPNLKHITLGGEAVSQELLDRLSAVFPKVPITQIYASTEMGACFYVRDGKAGLPLDVLKKRNGVQAKIINQEMFIRSSRAMDEYVSRKKWKRNEWFPTGDIVRKENERIYFIGRKQSIINVGGFKVYPFEVEELIQRIPGVLHVRVSAEKSSVLGELVKADVEVEMGSDKTDVKNKIIAVCQKKLASPKVPRVISIGEKKLIRGSKIDRRLS